MEPIILLEIEINIVSKVELSTKLKSWPVTEPETRRADKKNHSFL